MKRILFMILVFATNGFSQPAPVTPPPAAPPERPFIKWADANDQDYYGYNDYYYGGGGYGYGGYGGRGRDWNNSSDGRYESRGNHRGADRARGGGGGGHGR